MKKKYTDEHIEWLRSVRNSGLSNQEKMKHIGASTISQLKSVEYQNNIWRDEDAVVVIDGKKRVRTKKGGISIHWTADMLSCLKRLYPTTMNAELSSMLSVSPSTLIRKAREMGLEKDAQWMKSVNKDNMQLMHSLNRKHGNSGMFRKGCASNAYTYAPGHEGTNCVPVNQLTESGEFVARHKSIKQAAISVGRTSAAVYHALSKYTLCAGFRFEYDKKSPVK